MFLIISFLYLVTKRLLRLIIILLVKYILFLLRSIVIVAIYGYLLTVDNKRHIVPITAVVAYNLAALDSVNRKSTFA